MGNLSSKIKSYTPIIITIVVLMAILATVLILWARTTTPMRAEGAPEEQVLNYIPGQNFVLHGFLSRGFLTDYSLDPSPEAPPIYYTHFPPLPNVIIGGLIAIGIDSLPEVRLLMNIIFVLGLLFVVLFFWRHLSPWHGIGVLIFLGLNNRSVLAYSDHIVYAYWFGLTFLAFWALTLRSKSDRFLWLGFTAILLISLINYVQLVVTLVALVGLWLIRMPNLTLKRTLTAGAVGLGGVALHILQNLLVLGWDVGIRDLLYTIGNRIIGQPSRDTLLEFALENDLVLWGVKELAPVASRFGWLWAEYRYFLIPLLISLAGLGLLAYLRRSPTATYSLKLMGVLTVASTAWHIIFQAHGQAYQLSLIPAVPVAIACGFFIGEIVPILSRQFKALLRLGVRGWNQRAVLFPVLMAVAGLVTLWQGATLGIVSPGSAKSLYSPAAVEELEILKNFRGEGFWTNVTPHLVGYYTESWVVGQMPLAAALELDASKAFVTTISKHSPTWEEASKPHYFFFSRHNVVLNLEDRGERLEQYRRYLEENFPVLAWSPYGSMVLDLSWGPFGTSHLVTGRPSDIPSFHAKLPIAAEQIEVSSANSPGEGAENLVAVGTKGYWLKSPGEQGAWVQVDIGSPQAVSVVRILPREGYPDQLWDGNSALLEGSDDGVEWEPLTILGLERESITNDWISFPVHNTHAYQYYRLSIRDPSFRSLSRLEFYLVQAG